MRLNNRRIICYSLIIILAVILSGCASDVETAAKRIEAYLQEPQVVSYESIDIDKLDAQRAMDTIEELASDKYKGRLTGTKGNEQAVQYITSYFKKIGLENPEGLNNYQQPFNMPVILLKNAPKLEITKQDGSLIKSYEYPKNFIFASLSDKTNDIKLNGYMENVESVEQFSKLSPDENKVLLFSADVFKKHGYEKIREAAYSINSTIIIEFDTVSESRKYGDLPVMTFSSARFGEQYMPLIYVDSQTFAELSNYAKELNKVKIECSYEAEKIYEANNIVGYIPGSDEILKNEYIIIGAHMDHAGDNLNGTYNPGALDNASGTATIMEIARVMTENLVKPKKTVIFIAFNAEEYGLVGSKFYTEHPIFPLDNTVMINLDMVGSSYKLPISIENNKDISEIKLEFAELAKYLGIAAEVNKAPASDFYYFEEKGIPALSLIHADLTHGLHTPDDTLEDVDVERLGEILKLVLYYIDCKAY